MKTYVCWKVAKNKHPFCTDNNWLHNFSKFQNFVNGKFLIFQFHISILINHSFSVFCCYNKVYIVECLISKTFTLNDFSFSTLYSWLFLQFEVSEFWVFSYLYRELFNCDRFCDLWLVQLRVFCNNQTSHVEIRVG